VFLSFVMVAQRLSLRGKLVGFDLIDSVYAKDREVGGFLFVVGRPSGILGWSEFDLGLREGGGA
jgi:hypothetical protein